MFDFGDFEKTLAELLKTLFQKNIESKILSVCAPYCIAVHGYREATHITYVEESILSLTHLYIHSRVNYILP